MEVGFHGVYREIDAPRRIVSTEAFEGLVAMGITDDPDSVASVNTVTLDEVDGVTTMSTLVQHVTKEHRDGHINSGHGRRHAGVVRPPRGPRHRPGLTDGGSVDWRPRRLPDPGGPRRSAVGRPDRGDGTQLACLDARLQQSPT